jgi:hypothetical protein
MVGERKKILHNRDRCSKAKPPPQGTVRSAEEKDEKQNSKNCVLKTMYCLLPAKAGGGDDNKGKLRVFKI